ncbi:MAG TPA: hypothetical protein ENO23_10430, partial [Alphaproteobacteria bacterium]|nr:hypothetical protein [Alphaproteobacteria bacterium]
MIRFFPSIRRAFLCALALAATAAAAPRAQEAPHPYRLLHGDILRRLESPRARLLAPPPSAGQLAYDVLHYDLDVAVFPDSGEIDGTAAVTIVCLVAGLDSIDLDLDPVLAVSW